MDSRRQISRENRRRYAVAASTIHATDFLAPIFGASEGTWTAILTGGGRVAVSSPTDRARDAYPLASPVQRMVCETRSRWRRNATEVEAQSWLSETYDRLEITARVLQLDCEARAAQPSLWLSGRPSVPTNLLVSQRPWEELVRRNAPLRGDATNLTALMHGELGHVPWYLRAAPGLDQFGRHLLAIEDPAFVEPFIPADPQRSALGDRAVPSGSHLLDYRTTGRVPDFLAAFLPSGVQAGLERWAVHLEAGARRGLPLAMERHAASAVEAAWPRQHPDAWLDRPCVIDQALGCLAVLRRQRSRQVGHDAADIAAVERCTDAVSRLLQVAFELGDVRPRSTEAPARFELFLRERSDDQSHRLALMSESATRSLLVDALVGWWRYAEQHLRATLPVLTDLLTPSEFLHAVAGIKGARRRVPRGRYVCLRGCTVDSL